MVIPIGRFSRGSRLSLRALRMYDAIGLLPAAVVDPDSGYRYYRLEQLSRAAAIRSLRSVGMPLAQIAEFLTGSTTVLTSHLQALIAERNDHERKLQELQRLIEEGVFQMSTSVTVKQLPAQFVALERMEVTHESVFSDIPAGFGRVLQLLGRASVNPVGAPFTIFHRAPDPETAGDVSVCIPIGAGQPVGGSEVVELGPAVIASLVHRGPYETMAGSYAGMAAWLHEHGHAVTGPTREVYLNSPADVAEDELLTEIQFPIDAAVGEGEGSGFASARLGAGQPSQDDTE